MFVKVEGKLTERSRESVTSLVLTCNRKKKIVRIMAMSIIKLLTIFSFLNRKKKN